MMAISKPELPSGPAERRTMHFFWLLDGSGSMAGEKIKILNFAVGEAAPAIRRFAEDMPEARLLVQALRFAIDIDWIVAEPTPIADCQWPDVIAGGDAAVGKAINAVVDALDRIDTRRKYFAPVIILVSGGRNTDGKLFDDALQRLMIHPIGRRSNRFAIAIGSDADTDNLKCFIANDKIPVFQSTDADSVVDYLYSHS